MRYSGKRWAVFTPPHPNGVPQAKPFDTERDRDAWVAENSIMRKAVGQRHPAVSAWRDRNDQP